MVSNLVLMTDALRRGECLVRDLSAVHACRMLDVDEAISPIWKIYGAPIDRQPYQPLMPAKALAILKDTVGPIAGALVCAIRLVAAAIDA